MWNAPARWLRRCWHGAWPACLLVGAFVVTWIGSALTWMLSPGTRSSDIVWFGGLAFLLVFGIPLLIAWGIWSGFGLRHWAGRLALYGVIVLCEICLFGWLFVQNPPQM